MKCGLGPSGGTVDSSVANLESLPLETAAQAPISAAPRARATVRDLVALTKPRITLIVLMTGAAGMFCAPGHIAARGLWLSLVGTALIVGSANALNMWWERDVDGKMSRTKSRPLPAGRMTADVALGFGLLLAVVSTPMLFAVNVATGLLGLLALVSYVAIYTPLKRHSWLALLVGAIPGAMPPLMGWTAVTGTLDAGGLILFAFLFLWQVPHFGAIALFRREDYANAGLKVLSVDRGDLGAKRVMLLYTAFVVATSLLLFPFGVGGAWFLAVASVLGVLFFALGMRGMKMAPEKTDRWAKQLFGFSIVYLLGVLAALLLDHPVA